MNKITRAYFEKYIDQGLGHVNISEETVSFRKNLIRTKIEMIATRLPVELRTREFIEQLSTELAEVSVVIQAFGIRVFGVLPSKSLQAKETLHFKSQDTYYKGPHWNSYFAMLNDYISVCKSKLERLLSNKSSTLIQLKIDGVELTVPDEIQTALIESVTMLLEESKAKNKSTSAKGKDMNIFFNLIAHKLARFIQIEYFKRPAYYGNPSQVELLIISFTLMAAGFLSTPEEYEIQKRVKDYRSTLNKELYEATGKKKPKRDVRFYTHNEILVISTKNSMKATKGFNVRILNWLWS